MGWGGCHVDEIARGLEENGYGTQADEGNVAVVLSEERRDAGAGEFPGADEGIGDVIRGNPGGGVVGLEGVGKVLLVEWEGECLRK